MKKTGLAILTLALLFCPLTGRGEDFKVKQYTSDDGLPDNSIRTILQDSRGFIWLGMVGSGLVRYDGHNFSGILENDRINTLSEDNTGHLWISSMKGEPLCYDFLTERFIDFTPEGACPRYKIISHIGEQTWLWDRNIGCMVVTGDGSGLVSLRLDSYSSTLPDNRVNYILGGTGNRVWIGTRKGLAYFRDGSSTIVDGTNDFISGTSIGGIDYHITRDGQVFTLAPDGSSLEPAASLELNEDVISAVACAGRQWLIQSRHSGAFLFDIDNLAFIPAPKEWDIPAGRVENDSQGNSYITNGSGNILFFDRTGGGIHKISIPKDGENTHSERFRYHRTSDGILLITSRSSGLYRYDIEKDELSRINFNRNLQNGSNNVLLYSIEDREGNLWSASEFYGLFKLVPVSRGVSFINFGNDIDANRICMVSTAHNREVWISSEDRKMYTFSADLKQRKNEMSVPAITDAVFRLSDGRFAFCTLGEGLIVGFDRYNAANSTLGNFIYCGLEDSKSRIWVGTMNSGLAVGTKDKNGKYTFKSFAGTEDRTISIRSLCMDRRGNIWVGTEQDGAIYFNPDELLGLGDDFETAIHKINLASDNISTIFLDSRNNIWLAESGSGFSIVSGDINGNHRITHYGMEDGLSSNIVNGFTEGADGSMWIATSNGLSRMDPQSGTITNHILSSEATRNLCYTGSIRTLRDGRIAVGTGGGLAIVAPDEAGTQQHSEGKLRLTEFRLGGVKAGPGDADYPAEMAVGYLDGITLPFKQNNFTICFSSMDFAQNVSYDYRLEGYDSKWSHCSSEGSATYRNVRPGKYTFVVQISGREAAGNSIRFNIKIKFPPYASPVALVIYLLVFIAVITAAFLTFHRISKLKARAEMEKSLSEYKATFFTNISHEFRTPLTLIVSSLDDIKTKYADNIANDRSFKVMEKGAGRLRALVEQLLEIKKFNEEKQILHMETADVVLFIRDIYNTFLDSAAGRKTKFSFESGKDSFIMPFDKSAMDKIAFNLISNALKYTPEGESVKISLSFSDKFTFKVTDTGIGVAENLRDHLFDRFAKGDNGKDSVGLGLSLTKTLVENHKGSISYEPNPGGGSVFIVTLPVNISAYGEEDYIVTTAVIEDEEIEFKYEKPLNPQTILVIEDDSNIRDIIVEALSEYFNVISACDGEKGLALLEEGHPVELIVSDIMMPGISGYEVTEKVKSDFATCHIPVILLTSLSSNEDRYEGARRGADAFITKPFSKKYILIKIIKLLEQRSKLREKYSSDLSLRPDVLCNNKIDREFLDKIEIIMEKHLGDTMFSMDAFAEEMNMGRTAFYSKVSAVTGYSPNNYIKIFRMKKAAELISTGRLTAAETAYKVGIKDASYFTKLFKEQFGMTPKEYLKQAREKGPEAQ